MSREVVVAELIRGQARQLKMPGLARSFEVLSRKAREDKWNHEDYLKEVLDMELVSRADSAMKNRIQQARFPDLRPLEKFDFSKSDGIDAQQIATLAKGDWITRGHNVIFAGPIGTGKTHLATALGLEACKQLKHVRFWRAADLVQTLIEARDERDLTRLQRRLQQVDLLIVDELGFVPFDRTGGELLFNLLAHRNERRAVLITTNLAFSEWPKVFGGDEKLTTALLDRLAEHATVITTKGKSFRSRRPPDDGDKKK